MMPKNKAAGLFGSAFPDGRVPGRTFHVKNPFRRYFIYTCISNLFNFLTTAYVVCCLYVV